MSIARSILGLLGIFTGTTSRSTEVSGPGEIKDIMGRSLTDPFTYGLIFKVMGESLTDPSLLGMRPRVENGISGERETLTEVDWMEVDEEEDGEEPEGSVPPEEAIPGISKMDFEALEECVDGNDDREATMALDIVSRLRGTGLYEALRGNERTRERIASLLSSVERTMDTANTVSLPDMTDFLTVK